MVQCQKPSGLAKNLRRAALSRVGLQFTQGEAQFLFVLGNRPLQKIFERHNRWTAPR